MDPEVVVTPQLVYPSRDEALGGPTVTLRGLASEPPREQSGVCPRLPPHAYGPEPSYGRQGSDWLGRVSFGVCGALTATLISAGASDQPGHPSAGADKAVDGQGCRARVSSCDPVVVGLDPLRQPEVVGYGAVLHP
jgi:hypothetical protein